MGTARPSLATRDDVRSIALSLPDARDEAGFVFSVAGKAFAWSWGSAPILGRARRGATRTRRPAAC